MPVVRRSIFFIFWIVCLSAIPLEGLSYGSEDVDYSLLRSRINSYKEFESEEIINYSRMEDFLSESKESLPLWQQDFQNLALSERSSLVSPVQRKRLKVRLFSIQKESSEALEDLTQAREECSSRLEILNSFSNIWSAPPAEAPEDIKILLKEGGMGLKQLKTGTEKQLLKVDSLLKRTNRLHDRIIDLQQREKNNLFQVWKTWLLEGGDPVVSTDFWEKVVPGKAWLDLKQSELSVSSRQFSNQSLHFMFIVLGVFITGVFLIRMMDSSDYFLNRSEIERKKSLRLLFISCFAFAVYMASRIVFPYSLDSIAIVAFGVLYWAVLRLSKLICREKMVFIDGEKRAATLFVVSGLLLIHNVPERIVVFAFLLLLLSFWGYATYKVWTKKRGQGVSIVARQGSLLSPFFVIAMFGYGRLACVLVLLWSLGLFIRGFGTAFSQILFLRTEMSVELKKGLIRSLAVPAGWAAAFGIAAFWLIDFFGESAVYGFMDTSISHGDYSISLGSIVWMAVFFFMTRQCVSAFNVSIEYVGSNWSKAKKGAVPSIQTLFAYAVWAVFSLAAFRVLGLSLTSVTVIAGGLSVGIGFGLQNIVNNFIGGLILLFGRSIQQGDVIELNNIWCTVRKINIRTTVVETFENAVIMIPNSDLIAAQVTNWTKNNPVIRRDIHVGVAYGSDIQKVNKVLLKLAEEHSHVLKTPAPYVLFNDFGSSSLDFILRVWIDDIDVTLSALSELRFAIDKAFREEAIEISFPQLDVHVKQGKIQLPA
ncbi:mechanosensitive ion channel family protein [Maridesulfovibrio sp.]|uniref:mechanosensitive ion channel family protein n=1 Tax=Maridesulfovibrio sp. TaxID=2795000 RepID=UPI0039F0403F